MSLQAIAALHGHTELNHGRTETSALRLNSVANGPAGTGRGTSCGCWRDRARHLIASYCVLLQRHRPSRLCPVGPGRGMCAVTRSARRRPGVAPYCVEMRLNASDCVLLRLVPTVLPCHRSESAQLDKVASHPPARQRVSEPTPSPSTYVFAPYCVSLRLMASIAAQQRASEQGKV